MTKLSEAVERVKRNTMDRETWENHRFIRFEDLVTLVRALEERKAALRVFMGEDELFIVSIGGNPIAIEKFLTSARAALKEE